MNRSWIWSPRRGNGYPFDFDGSERYTRPKTGIDFFPYPPIVGMLSGFMPQMDLFVWSQAYGKKAYGPGTAPIVNLGYQAYVPGLTKYVSQPGQP
jgi:hypothetical protein